jgi:hypothetical protein
LNLRDLAHEIKRRATWLRLASAIPSQGDEVIDQATAQLIAAQQIGAEQRAKKRSGLLQQQASSTEISVANARRVFLARLAALSERIKASSGIVPPTPAPPEIRKHTDDDAAPAAPPAPINKQPEPEIDQVVGVITGRSSSFELIPQSEFHTSMFDRTTDNWRRSIQRNERIAAEREMKRRESRWVG